MLRTVSFFLLAVLLLGGGPPVLSTGAPVVRPAVPSADSLPEPISDVRRDRDRDAVPDRLADTVTVDGRVTGGPNELPLPMTNFVVVQEWGAGLHVQLPEGAPVARGDSLHVRGVLRHKHGLAQLEGLHYTVVDAPGREPAPMPLTVSAAAQDHYEGRLARVEGRVAATGANDGGDYLILQDRKADTAAQLTVFVGNRHATRFSLDFSEGDEIAVTGVIGQHDYNPPYRDYYQILPREPADLDRIEHAHPYLWGTLYVFGGGGLLALLAVVVLRLTVRRRTRELETSRARFRGLANSVPGVLFQFTGSPGAHEFQFVSDRAEDILGLPSDETVFFDRWIERVPSSHREALLESIDEATKEKARWQSEFPFKKSSGEQIWLLGTAAPPKRLTGEATFNGVLLDITERKRAEGRAQLQTTILRQITEGRPLSDILRELVEEVEAQRPGLLGSVVLYDAAENTVRHGAAPNLPDAYTRAIDGAEVGPKVGSCGTAMHTRSSVVAEDIESDPRWADYREVALQHDLRACWSVPIQDAENNVLGAFAMYYREEKTPDSADWSLIEEARSLARIALVRHQANKQLRLLTEAVEQSTESVLITEGTPLDPPGPRIEYVNPAFEQMTGYRADEVQGRTPRLFQGPRTNREVLDSLRDALEAGDTWRGETINYRKDGSTYRVRWSTAPVRNRNGEIEHWVSVQRDVTEERKRQRALKEAKEAAEEAAHLKSALLANMSHEIRTPLTSIIGFAEALGEETASQGGSASRFARLIEKSGRRLLDTLNTVLTLSKLEAGQMDLSTEPIDVAAELGDTADQFVGQATDAEIDLQVEVPSSPVRALGNRGGLRIVLQNLVSNALKYTEAGGNVWLRVYKADGHATLEVEDTGIGMDAERIEELFEPFRQASEGLDRKYEGAGLGLAVTKKAVEQMGGRIEVETEEGEGTCFVVRLPQRRPHGKERSRTPERAGSS